MSTSSAASASACRLRVCVAGLRLADLRSVFITHLHSDHAIDYVNLMLRGW